MAQDLRVDLGCSAVIAGLSTAHDSEEAADRSCRLIGALLTIGLLCCPLIVEILGPPHRLLTGSSWLS
jgi:hypothetical protein